MTLKSTRTAYYLVTFASCSHVVSYLDAFIASCHARNMLSFSFTLNAYALLLLFSFFLSFSHTMIRLRTLHITHSSSLYLALSCSQSLYLFISLSTLLHSINRCVSLFLSFFPNTLGNRSVVCVLHCLPRILLVEYVVHTSIVNFLFQAILFSRI